MNLQSQPKEEIGKDPTLPWINLQDFSVLKIRTFLFMFLLSASFCCYFYPLMVYLCYFIKGDRSTLIISLETLILIVGAATTGVCLALLYYAWRNYTFNSFHGGTYSFSKWEIMLRLILPSLTSIYFALVLIYRSLRGSCQDHRPMIGDWSCNPYDSIRMIPMDTALILMGVPFIAQALLRGNNCWALFCCWLIVFVGMIVSASVLKSEISIPVIICYFVGSLIVLNENLDLQAMLVDIAEKVSSKIEEENAGLKEKEIRGMIANVAHDLKTPLTSFMTGVDIILKEITDSENKCRAISHFRRGSLKESVNGNALSASTSVESIEPVQEIAKNLDLVKACALNIRNTNSFMLMSINRCLDYAKASQGLKLTPKYETIDLKESLTLPLNCMMNIQQKVKISLEPLPELMLSHVVTDKQWLQENILCLLSNAVKYSSGGDVKITLSLQPRPLTLSGKVHRDTVNSLDSVNIPNSELDSIHSSTFGSRLGRTRTSSDSISITKIIADFVSVAPSFRSRDAKISPYNSFNTGNTAQSRYHTNSITAPTAAENNNNISLFSPPISPTPSFYASNGGGNSPVSKQRKSDPLNPTTTRLINERDLDSFSEMIVVEIVDQGIGMSDDAMQALFNPFKQNQRLAGGTGLGLYSLAKRIEALKGQYGVKRRDDGQQGSVFWFSIPYRPDKILSNLAKRMAALTHAHSSNSNSSQVHRYSLSSDSFEFNQNMMEAIEENPIEMKHSSSSESENLTVLNILLAEDTASIAKMTTMMLKKMGHTVTVAENGALALNLLTSSYEKLLFSPEPVDKPYVYDVVLMDLQMPVMDGLEATRRLREYEKKFQEKTGKTIHQMVIGVTAANDEETFDEGMRMGIDDFMAKPFTMDDLYTKVFPLLRTDDSLP